MVVGGGSEGSEVCGLELDTGGGNGAANIGGGNACMPIEGGGVGLGTDVAVAGDNWEAVLLLCVIRYNCYFLYNVFTYGVFRKLKAYLIQPCDLVYAGRLELAGEVVFGTLTGVMLPRLRLLTLLL